MTITKHNKQRRCSVGRPYSIKQHSQGETAFPGGAACPEKHHAQGGSIKGLNIAHLQFHVKVLCITFLLCAAPPGMQLPLPPRYAVPRYTAPPVHAPPFWICCYPLGLLLPLWKASNKANLLQSRFILLIIILILKKR
jgi:hypothetical protein